MAKNKYEIPQEITDQIQKTLIRDEMGGILGSDKEGTVTHYHFDSSGTITKNNEYIPDIGSLNEKIVEWYKKDIRFVGFVHSHVHLARDLSPADIEYANQIVESCGLDHLLMLLYLPKTKEMLEYIIPVDIADL